jgi:para-nitrobenzyl esterase
LIIVPVQRLAEAQAAAGATVYYYELQYSIPTGPFGPNSPHGIDVPLIFENIGTNFARSVFGYSPRDLPMAMSVHAAWVSFIKSGNMEGGFPSWPRYDTVQRRAMKIDRRPAVSADVDGVERRIWADVG